MNTFTDFHTFQSWLYDKSSFHMKLGLSRMGQALQALQLMHPARPSDSGDTSATSPAGGHAFAASSGGLSFPIIQVLGTNGKGSTSSFISSLARTHGLKTGLYTSPHFLSPRERVLIDGQQLAEQTWVDCANAIIEAGGEDLTYFEFITVLAALAFQRAGVDLAVFEAGLGGKNDATTSLPAQLTVITPISLDHQQIIGPELADIARDKAGAIRSGNEKNGVIMKSGTARNTDLTSQDATASQRKTGVTVISAAQSDEVQAILRSACEEKKAQFTSVANTSILPPEILNGKAKLGLWGKHQFANASVALTAWRCFCVENGIASSPPTELKGLQEAWIAGRLQWIEPAEDEELPGQEHPLFILDGAHNPHGLAALGKSLAESGTRPAACIFTCVADKDVAVMAAHLRVLCPAPIFVPPLPDNPRALPPQELAQIIGLAATPVSSFSKALAKAAAQYKQTLSELPPGHTARHPVLICGSLYLLAEFFKVYPDYLAGPSESPSESDGE